MMYRSLIPADFLCPITQDIMHDPVLLVDDGHSYERFALEKWLENNNTSPMTNQQLKTKTIVVNYNLKSTIEDYRQKQTKSIYHSFKIYYGAQKNNDLLGRQKLEIIISLLGASGVGKSCLIANLQYGSLPNSFTLQPTVGMDIHFCHLDYLFEDKYTVIIKLYDCEGSDRFESVSDQHFRNCHGAILMIDSTNIESFERLQSYWFKRLREKSSFDNVETVLACNKIDLSDKNYSSEYFSQIDRFASEYQIPVYNTSAIRGDNVQALFHRLLTNIFQNQILVKAMKDKSTEIRFEFNERSSSKKCC